MAELAPLDEPLQRLADHSRDVRPLLLSLRLSGFPQGVGHADGAAGCPGGVYGCHNDGNPANNRPDNLRWDTPSSNNHDRIAHGHDRQASKTKCPRGHLLVHPNLVACKARHGHRNCLACDRAKKAGGDWGELADNHYARIMRAA